MFKVSSDQLESASDTMQARFVRQSVDFLKVSEPVWSADKADAEIEAFIDEMTEFAKDHEIMNAGQIQRLMQLKLREAFDIPLAPYPAMKLTQDGMSEGRRVDAFAAALRQKTAPVLITLDTDLGA